MSKREGLIRAYLGALDTKPVLIHAGPNGTPAKVGFEPDRKFDLLDALWFAKPQHAELVLMSCRADFRDLGAERPQGWIDMSAREVRDHVINTSAQLGATWCTLAEIRTDAEAAVDEILADVEKSRRDGKLAEVNARYKTYRQVAQHQGEKAVPYSAYLADFTKGLVVLAAKNADLRKSPKSVR